MLAYLGLRHAAPTLDILESLIRSVPWESASRIAKRSHTSFLADYPRWPVEFWQDALASGGGGTCFESNYALTLVDQPVEEGVYRTATTADYGAQGFFLDQVIISKVIDEQVWRFNSGDRHYHLESFVNGTRTDHLIQGNLAEAVAAHFGMNLDIVHRALSATGAI